MDYTDEYELPIISEQTTVPRWESKSARESCRVINHATRCGNPIDMCRTDEYQIRSYLYAEGKLMLKESRYGHYFSWCRRYVSWYGHYFSRYGLSALVLVPVTPNSEAYQAILHNYVLPTFWLQINIGLFIF